MSHIRVALVMGHVEAVELGEALIDAGYMTNDSQDRHEIEFIEDRAVAVPSRMVAMNPPEDQQVDIIVIN